MSIAPESTVRPRGAAPSAAAFDPRSHWSILWSPGRAADRCSRGGGGGPVRRGGNAAGDGLRGARKIIEGTGVLVFLIGVGGTIDHLWHQPFPGIVLNSFNRFVVPNTGLFQEHALFANPAVAVLGAALVLAAGSPTRRR